MTGLPLIRPQDRVNQALAIKEKAQDTLALSFYELAPVNKRLFTITPSQRGIAIDKIQYSFGSTDLSNNGYIQLLISRINNPDVYAVVEQNSNVVFSQITGANAVLSNSEDFLKPIVSGVNESLYVFLISNIPLGDRVAVFGRLSIFYRELYL